jgi:ferric-dicitrate binding protein FerR (iron transport regulator)
MNEKHYKEKLSEFVNHELSNDERHLVAGHLLLCADCRAEHDRVKLGAALAENLQRADAPATLWSRIENALDGEKQSRGFVFPFFSSPAFAAAAGLLLIGALAAAIYFGLNRNGTQETVKVKTTNTEAPKIISTPDGAPANQNKNSAIPEIVNSNVPGTPPDTNSNGESSPNVAPVGPPDPRRETYVAQNNLPAWNVETLAGAPKIGNSFESGKLAVGQFLETDANSRARVQVANIGNVEIEPNSRIQLVGTKSTEHRLSLERGILSAKISAPPRLFIVDTPSAIAVDLGCEYTLEVDKNGNSKLHVKTGYVALERGGRDVIVPAGAIALTKKGKGVGTPFSEDASLEFQKALASFDFENGGTSALLTIIKEANFYDTISLWHLLSRTRGADREKVFDALSKYVKPPAGTTREGVLKLDKKMLDQWWTEIENIWFE